MILVLQNDERKIFMLNTSKSDFVRQNAFVEGGKRQDLNNGPQYPWCAINLLSLFTMLGL